MRISLAEAAETNVLCHFCVIETKGLGRPHKVKACPTASVMVLVRIEIEGRRQAREIADRFGVIRTIQLVEAAARREGALLEHDRSVVVDLENPIIELIADQRVPVAKMDRARRQRIGIPARLLVGEILPNDSITAVHLDDPVVV